MSNVFLDYSKYYDLLYKDKDYKSEVEFLITQIKKYNPKAKTILNLGCGTGQHDFYLRQSGYDVTGVDLSNDMLEIAKIKNPDCRYYHGDARSISINTKYDIVLSLFHVLSYQTSNSDVNLFFNTVSNQLNPNGVAIFDYWYGPAVLNLRPEKRTKFFESNELSITRVANTDIDYLSNVAYVNFNISVLNKFTKDSIQLNEKHPMRFFFTPELDLFLTLHKFKNLGHYAWPSSSSLPSETSWAAYSVISK